MFAKRLQRGMRGDVAVDVDDDYAGGGWSLPEAIPAAFPPSDLHRRRPADSLFLCFRSPPPPGSGTRRGVFL
jgi:hypothetical protein